MIPTMKETIGKKVATIVVETPAAVMKISDCIRQTALQRKACSATQNWLNNFREQ